MKISKQQVGLAIVLCGGLCAIGVDRFVLRPGGGLSNAAAAVAEKVEAGLLQSTEKAVPKEVVDRTSAAIADRLEKLPVEAVNGSRDAFAEPWKEIQKVVESELGTPAAIAKSESKVSPWTVTSVSSSGGKVAIVLNGKIVLTPGAQTSAKEQVELLDVQLEGENPAAKVRDTATGDEYILKLPVSVPKSNKR